MIPLVSVFGSIDMLNRIGLIIMYLGLASSMSIFLYYGTLRGLPQELGEASLIDGSNRFQIYLYIIFLCSNRQQLRSLSSMHCGSGTITCCLPLSLIKMGFTQFRSRCSISLANIRNNGTWLLLDWSLPFFPSSSCTCSCRNISCKGFRKAL